MQLHSKASQGEGEVLGGFLLLVRGILEATVSSSQGLINLGMVQLKFRRLHYWTLKSHSYVVSN
jgi:hypothetical protein